MLTLCHHWAFLFKSDWAGRTGSVMRGWEWWAARVLCLALIWAPVAASGLPPRAAAEPGAASCDEPRRTTPEFDGMETVDLEMVNDVGARLRFAARVADEPRERYAGFQAIGAEIIASHLILFVFSADEVRQFHMRNVSTPLDIAFLASDGRVLEVQSMAPESDTVLRVYTSGVPFRYALEARPGFFLGHHISPGKSWLLLP
jgi:uncharacterized membrane protein (UPF0127 family)